MVEMIGPYRVHDRLGVGGMGEVYKAYDERLDRWVAIKRIRPDRLDSEDNRERFKREARATAKLNHPSIVHLYGIFQEDESDCIVMEYVEGETLDRILANGPLDAYRVASLGYEIASGLAEAHSNGILHRDLKAENIIITGKGRAKILDFGLAKPLLDQELDPMLTGKGQLVGTSRAMSPEYVGGDAIDHRSDLFSLGVLLYECSTGKSPFKAHNTLATLKQVMLHRQTPVHEINTDVPPTMSELIDRLLAKEPAKRPQSAEDVAVEFGQILSQMSSSTIDLPGGGFVRSSTSSGTAEGTTSLRAFSASDTVLDLRAPRRWVPIVSILAVLVVGAFMLGYFLQQPKRNSLADGEVIQIVLGEFENNTSDPQFENTLAQAFRVGLEQSRAIQALPPSQIREALQRMERPADTELDRDVAVEIARRENAEGVVLGSIAQVGPQYVLTAEVVNPHEDTSRHLAKQVVEGDTRVLAALDELTRDVRAYLGESREAIQRDSRPLERVTTARLAALEAYTAGVAQVENGDPDAAVGFFRRAIEIDPGFAMAHAKLVVLHSNEGNRSLAERHVGLALAESDRLTDLEKLYVEGWAARWNGSSEDVVEVWRLMSELHPVYEAHLNLGLSYWFYYAQYAEAEKAFAAALTLATSELERQNCRWFLGYSALAQDNVEAARMHFEHLDGTDYQLALADLARATGDSSSAESFLNSIVEESVESDYRKGLVLLDQKLNRQAEKLFLDSLRLLSTESSLSQEELNLALGAAVVQMADYSVSRPLGRSVEILVENATVNPLSVDGRPSSSKVSFLASIGKAEARAGLVQQASGRLETLRSSPESLPISTAFVAILEGEIMVARGDNEDAVELFEGSLKQFDLWQLRESYAFALRAGGYKTKAESQREILLSRRPLAVVECINMCFSQAAAAMQYQDLLSDSWPELSSSTSEEL
ncbi:MAG: protein kinase [Acidobacteriota bacterium]